MAGERECVDTVRFQYMAHAHRRSAALLTATEQSS